MKNKRILEAANVALASVGYNETVTDILGVESIMENLENHYGEPVNAADIRRWAADHCEAIPFSVNDITYYAMRENCGDDWLVALASDVD